MNTIFKKSMIAVAMLLFSICAFATFIGCNSEPKKQAQTHEDCVEQIFKQDSINGHQRNQDPKEMPLSKAIASYVERSKELDFTSCDEKFKAAFEAHIDAWKAFQTVSDKHSERRGELHAIFSEITKTEDSIAFKEHLDRILLTWKAVKTLSKQSEVPKEAAYFGQEPPGLTPKKFALGMVSTDNLEIAGNFAPDMQSFYFIRQVRGEPSKVRMIRYENGAWQDPVVQQEVDGFFAADGNTVYIGNTYRERTVDGWSDLKKLGMPYDTIDIMRMTISDADTYVFDVRDTIGTIRYARMVNGKREAPKPFGKTINAGKWVAHPFIAPDESYLIWDAERDGGYGETDLYISFRQEDGSYGKAINMGPEINTPYEDGGGSITPDGKYFFYNTINIADLEANIYWVDAQIIEELRKKQ